MTTSTYVLRGGEAAAERLAVLAKAYGPTTELLFDRIGVRERQRCLDVGCGNGAVTQALARRAGHAVGLDADPGTLDVARRLAAEAGISADFRAGDARALDGRDGYDVVYARFLLTHVDRPVNVLRSMLGTLRPGGTLAIEDIDFRAHVCHPPCAAFDRSAELYEQASLAKGGDPFIGRKLYGWFRELGLEARVFVTQPVYATLPEKDLSRLTLEHISDNVVAMGLAPRDEIARLCEELRRFAANPTTIASGARIFQVWGTKP